MTYLFDMKIHDCTQGSDEWLKLRSGMVTASELDQLVTPMFKIRDGEMPKTYLSRKAAERWLGAPLPSFSAFDMEQGSLLEAEALPWFEFTYGTPINRVGFITTDDGSAGCSPDGLLPDDCGIEIKCPAAHTHVGYLLAGELPKDYAAQVHGSMYVTGFPRWKFLSYRRNFPPLLLTIKRDEEIQASIAVAVVAFNARLDAAMARLKDMQA